MVTSGMGGNGQRLRYFAALATLSKTEWNPTQQHLLHEELRLAAKNYDAKIEHVEFSGYLAKILLLMPLAVFPPNALLSETTKNCNELGKFIDTREVLTNVMRISDEELRHFFASENIA